jgi:hypothetical protein
MLANQRCCRFGMWTSPVRKWRVRGDREHQLSHCVARKSWTQTLGIGLVPVEPEACSPSQLATKFPEPSGSTRMKRPWFVSPWEISSWQQRLCIGPSALRSDALRCVTPSCGGLVLALVRAWNRGRREKASTECNLLGVSGRNAPGLRLKNAERAFRLLVSAARSSAVLSRDDLKGVVRKILQGYPGALGLACASVERPRDAILTADESLAGPFAMRRLLVASCG